jgi:hypothetical protein
LGGLLLYKSYANFEINNTYNVLKGTVPSFVKNDLQIAVKVDGVSQSDFPIQNDGYYYTATNITCTNGASAEWDNDKWGLLTYNLTKSGTKCEVNFTKQEQYTETILNGADPVLSGNLIAVKIADDGTVTKADVSTKWYEYENKVWANAVILKDKTKTYSDGETIPEDNIESYFVWIPKYSYQLWDLGEYTSATEVSSWSEVPASTASEIQIKFGTDNTTDKTGECATPMTSGATGNCTIGDYMTHPAFINSKSNGIWVGKFEIGYDGATTTTEAEVSSTDSTKIIVKPNVYSWRNNTVYNFFMASYNYYRTLDSHMMKNTEWGAVAYLSYTKYGINEKVWMNNNSNYVTGCVANSVSAGINDGCLNTYNTSTGYNGSTTGNISGIYDMSGGAWEYVAAYRGNTPGSSGFTTATLAEYASYLDVYNTESDVNTYNNRILGDATGEMGPFYKVGDQYCNLFRDFSSFVGSSLSWFFRGGAYEYGSARLVLVT